ncbi:MAG: hypothetical protein KIT27_09315 [Legionellales bacterium]|nr:hypothetical protein [Legionellales bacterium]
MPTSKNRYLGITLPNDVRRKKKKVVISSVPLNSSGDVYHILAYLILASHKKYQIPTILLMYDCDTTKHQAQRSANFLRVLGFGEHVEVNSLPRTRTSPTKKIAFRPNSRQADLERFFIALANKQKQSIAYLDQMACTSIIAQEFQKNATNTSEIIRNRLDVVDVQFFPKEQQEKVRHSIKNEMTRIIKYQKCQEKPLVIMHLRYSDGANSKQNIPDSVVPKIIKYLDQKGFCCWLILADSRHNPGKFSKMHKSEPFNKPYIETTINGVSYEYGKLIHVGLLKKLYQYEQYKGMIGNTSGTLDIASLMGHNVFNIHQFSYDAPSYQDYRILLQAQFMSVVDFDLQTLADEFPKLKRANSKKVVTTLFDNIEPWVEDEDHDSMPNITYFNKNNRPNYADKSGKAGFRKSLTFMIFKYPGKCNKKDKENSILNESYEITGSPTQFKKIMSRLTE